MVDTELAPLLKQMVEHKASDLFLSVGAKPLIKVEGVFLAVDDAALTPEQVYRLCYSVLNEEQRRELEASRELNMSLGLPGSGRFRLNFFRQRGHLAMVARHINARVPDFHDLNLPALLGKLALEDRGLILLVGGTGTGKSSTLAAMIEHRSKTRGGHILTIEDPIEFLHSHHNNSMINQREVGIDTESYDVALKNAMREAPNVIMIGEIRDKESMKHALAYAETGHLCLSTLHANNANQAIERILHFFPDTAHAQILQDLSLNLRAIVSQRLITGLGDKRVPAFEILLDTPFICELIKNGKIEELKDAMSQATELGCKTLDDALYDLVRDNKISQEEALRHADSRTNLALRFRLEGNEHPNQPAAKAANPRELRSLGSFRVTCVLFKSTNRELKQQLEQALRATMLDKGMQFRSDHPDIEIKFAFNAPPPVHTELALAPDNYDGTAMSKATINNETLVIDIFDMHEGKSVWRKRTSVSLDNGRTGQNEITRIISDLMAGYPQQA